jgi:hypothetical protein
MRRPSLTKAALGGRHFALGAGIDGNRDPQGTGEALEAGLGNMVTVVAI